MSERTRNDTPDTPDTPDRSQRSQAGCYFCGEPVDIGETFLRDRVSQQLAHQSCFDKARLVTRMPPCGNCGHAWGDHARPSHVEADVDRGERWCVALSDSGHECLCRQYIDTMAFPPKEQTVIDEYVDAMDRTAKARKGER